MIEFLQDNYPVLIMLGVIGVFWLVLRNRATKLSSVPDLDGRVGKGHPVLLRFFSNT